MKRFGHNACLFLGAVFLTLGIAACCVNTVVLTKPCTEVLRQVSGDKRLEMKNRLDKSMEWIGGREVEVVRVQLPVPRYAKYVLFALGIGILFFCPDGSKDK